MGYQTDFRLTVDTATVPVCPTCGHIGSLSFEELLCREIGFNPFGEPNKWYEWEEDMRKFSLKYPDVLFTLDGEGEENGDIWTAYFRNGKCQIERAVIQVMPFDPIKLE